MQHQVWNDPSIGSFIFNLIENYKVARKTPEQFGIKITEDHLSFFVDAYFDKSDRKWFWGNENEIQADQWAYQCSNLPHQPATDLVVTVKFDEISKYFLEIVNRCSSEGDVSTETDEFGYIIRCCTIRNREILLTLEFLGKYALFSYKTLSLQRSNWSQPPGTHY